MEWVHATLAIARIGPSMPRKPHLPSVLLVQQAGEAQQVQRPAALASDALADPVPAVAVPVDVAVLELYASAVRGLSDEAHLDFAGLVQVRFNLPARVEVPAEHDPVGWLVGQHACPTALAPVDRAVVDLAA